MTETEALRPDRWGGGGAGDVKDIGIGTGTGVHPDWTFLQNANAYATRRLRVFVR